MVSDVNRLCQRIRDVLSDGEPRGVREIACDLDVDDDQVERVLSGRGGVARGFSQLGPPSHRTYTVAAVDEAVDESTLGLSAMDRRRRQVLAVLSASHDPMTTPGDVTVRDPVYTGEILQALPKVMTPGSPYTERRLVHLVRLHYGLRPPDPDAMTEALRRLETGNKMRRDGRHWELIPRKRLTTLAQETSMTKNNRDQGSASNADKMPEPRPTKHPPKRTLLTGSARERRDAGLLSRFEQQVRAELGQAASAYFAQLGVKSAGTRSRISKMAMDNGVVARRGRGNATRWHPVGAPEVPVTPPEPEPPPTPTPTPSQPEAVTPAPVTPQPTPTVEPEPTPPSRELSRQARHAFKRIGEIDGEIVLFTTKLAEARAARAALQAIVRAEVSSG